MGLRAGDLFTTNGSGFIAKAIRVVQWFWSTDNEAPYNHSGIIINDQGATLESRWHFAKYFLEDYIGYHILVVRHKDMNKVRFIQGYDAVKRDIGRTYPWWRLPIHMVRLAKFFNWGRGVCSEQTGKFMKGAGFHNIVYGLTPDDLADRWRIDRDMTTVFEGVLTEDILRLWKEGVL